MKPAAAQAAEWWQGAVLINNLRSSLTKKEKKKYKYELFQAPGSIY
jgi:NADH dehydrogenase FAD-containing subunit